MEKKYTKKFRNIPTLPTVLAKIIATLDDPRSSTGDLERIIRNDQALTTKLLAVANSAYYGFRYEVTTVSRAAVAIGYDEVRNLCLGMSLMGFLHPNTFKDAKRAEALWLHSLATGEACRIIAEWTGGLDGEMAFTAGLLHDIGKVVLAAFYPDDVLKMKRLMREEKLNYRQAESEMQMWHQKIGIVVAEQWELPPILGEVIGNHHSLRRSLSYLQMAASVQAADHLARRLDMGDPMHPEVEDVSKLAYQALSFTEQTMMQCFADLKERQDKIVSLWSQLIGK